MCFLIRARRRTTRKVTTNHEAWSSSLFSVLDNAMDSNQGLIVAVVLAVGVGTVVVAIGVRIGGVSVTRVPGWVLFERKQKPHK